MDQDAISKPNEPAKPMPWRKLPKDQRSVLSEQIIKAYTTIAKTSDLCHQYNISRVGLHKLIRRAGVSTTKQSRRLPVTCAWCSSAFHITKSRARKGAHLHFCSQAHYFLHKQHQGNTNHQRGQRIAYSIIKNHFPTITDSNIPHHEDQNPLNNDLHNLRLFKNHA